MQLLQGAPQEAAAGATFTETEGQHAGTAPATPEMQPRRESEQLSAGVIRDLEARGFHRGRIEQGAPAPVGAGIETRPGMEAPVEHKEMKEVRFCRQVGPVHATELTSSCARC